MESHSNKADNLPAKDRKKKRTPKVKRRASAVKVSFLPVTRRVRRQQEAREVARVLSSEPEPDLTKQSRFIDMRPKNVHPWDWHCLYTEDEELWPDIAEEASYAASQGELKPYDRLR